MWVAQTRERGTVLTALAEDADIELAGARAVELAEEDALPGPQRELPVVPQRHEHLRPHQRCPRMRGSVLLTLLEVLPPPPFGNDLLERHLEVPGDERVGIRIDRQAGGRVRHVDEARSPRLSCH